MNSNTIVNTIQSIDIDKYHSIEKEREKILNDKEFQKWCKDLNIGSRVEVKDYRSNELMSQYTNYPKWVSRRF
jgi:ribosomal protein RSM22 (predicted rRNA methylase)